MFQFDCFRPEIGFGFVLQMAENQDMPYLTRLFFFPVFPRLNLFSERMRAQ
jgi:hypothetical protein